MVSEDKKQFVRFSLIRWKQHYKQDFLKSTLFAECSIYINSIYAHVIVLLRLLFLFFLYFIVISNLYHKLKRGGLK